MGEQSFLSVSLECESIKRREDDDPDRKQIEKEKAKIKNKLY
tara:strand:+ start:500 stop:625 length:126 start_codon:yes stop_codon:yes gene_type:complete